MGMGTSDPLEAGAVFFELDTVFSTGIENKDIFILTGFREKKKEKS